MKKIIGFKITDIMGGYVEGITRRDPSPVIKVDDTYHVWYSRTTMTHHGYTATIWHATSKDGVDWQEKEQALGRGPAGSFDEHAVFTPSILVFNNQYYLSYTAVPEPYYDGIGDQPETTPTTIGLAKASSPDGPWQKVSSNPILKPSSSHDMFDSLRIDDTCFVVREDKICMYYKGRQFGKSGAETKMGVAFAENPEGPYIKYEKNPVINSGHEVCVWPADGGVATLIGWAGPQKYTFQFSADGVNFEKQYDIEPPEVPGPYRADNFTDNADMELTWGICMVKDKKWPWLARFETIYE